MLLMTTPRCEKALVGFLAAFAPRRQNQRGFAAWCKALFQRPVLSKAKPAWRARRLTVIDRSCVLLAHGPLVATPLLGSQHRSPLQILSMSVLRGRLVASCSSLLSNPCLHVLSNHSSTVLPGVSLQVVFRRFQLSLQKCQCTSCAADRRQGCGAFRVIAATCFYVRSSKSLPTDLEAEQHAATQCPNTRCSWQIGCAFRTCLRKHRSSPTTSLNTKEFGERLKIGPAGRFLYAPQRCLAAARTNQRLCAI